MAAFVKTLGGSGRDGLRRTTFSCAHGSSLILQESCPCRLCGRSEGPNDDGKTRPSLPPQSPQRFSDLLMSLPREWICLQAVVAFLKGAECHFQNKRVPVAPIPKGHQARLYRRRANTSPHDSSQPRTFSDNVPHSKRSRLQIRRKRTTGWALHQEEPQT